MINYENLTIKEMKACQEYVKCGVKSEALRRAGYSGTKNRCSLFETPKAKAYLEKLIEQESTKYAGEISDVVALWTKIMNDPNEGTVNRLKASENLAKTMGMYVVTSKKTDKAPVIYGEDGIQD